MKRSDRVPLNDGDEQDVFSSWRHVMCWCHRAGAKARVKRMYRRRVRQSARRRLRQEVMS